MRLSLILNKKWGQISKEPDPVEELLGTYKYYIFDEEDDYKYDDPHICPECGERMVYEEYTAYGNLYYCPNCEKEIYR